MKKSRFTDSQIIAELINRGKLLTDVPPGS